MKSRDDAAAIVLLAKARIGELTEAVAKLGKWKRSCKSAAYAEHRIRRVMWSSGLCGVVSSRTGFPATVAMFHSA